MGLRYGVGWFSMMMTSAHAALPCAALFVFLAVLDIARWEEGTTAPEEPWRVCDFAVVK